MSDCARVKGLCGSYPSKPDRLIISGLPTTRPELSDELEWHMFLAVRLVHFALG